MPTAFLDHPRPMAFAHRGGAAHAPENSWRAFEHAVGLGYGYLETDVQATLDGALIAFHDRTLDRVTGRPGRIARMNHRELATALIDGTEPIPLLEDLLGAWPDVRFNIDLKDAPAIGPLAAVLRRTGAWDRVCVTSFSASRLRAARRVFDRQVCMAASPIGTAVVRFGGPRGPRDPTRPGRPGQVRRPASQSRPGQSRPAASAARAPQAAGRRGRARAGGAPGPYGGAVRPGAGPGGHPRLRRRAHALGLHVHAWTINSPPDAGPAGYRGGRHHDRRDRGAAGRADQPRRVAPPVAG